MRMTDVSSPDDPKVQAIQSRLANWKLHLPRSKRDALQMWDFIKELATTHNGNGNKERKGQIMRFEQVWWVAVVMVRSFSRSRRLLVLGIDVSSSGRSSRLREAFYRGPRARYIISRVGRGDTNKSEGCAKPIRSSRTGVRGSD